MRQFLPRHRSGKRQPSAREQWHRHNEYLGESIIKAHTQVAAPDCQQKEGIGGMGNYNDFLAVKDLADLVAFLKQETEGNVKG